MENENLEKSSTFPRPTLDQYKDILTRFGVDVNDDMAAKYLQLSEGSFKAYDFVWSAEEPEILHTPSEEREFIYPTLEENVKNAWYVKTNISSGKEGKLNGKKVVLKDCISLAKVPLMNGSDLLKGYVPEVDATVVTRVLDAGGIISGKAHCEYLCLSAGSHTGFQGPVHNAIKQGYSSGGSSSGVATLVALGEVDMGIGGDQGGSIRVPASFSGICGMKPTHGLVPYTGVVPIERTIDHVGPMTKTVSDNALLLEVIAGEDGLDPRQYNVKTSNYTEALGKPIAGMKVGVVKEGFELPNIEKSVKESVLNASKVFEILGAIVEEVSIPEHLTAGWIFSPISFDGTQEMMMNQCASGMNARGFYQSSLNMYVHNWQNKSVKLSPTLLMIMLIGQWSLDVKGSYMYGKAQNLAIKLRKAYDAKLEEYDVLLMPTLPITAKPIPDEVTKTDDLDLYMQRAFEMWGNTSPFDATGHPTMSIPWGKDQDGLPIGMMLIGKHYDEETIYKFAFQYEKNSILDDKTEQSEMKD